MNNIIKAGILTGILLLLITNITAQTTQIKPSIFTLVAREKPTTVCNITCNIFGAGSYQTTSCSCMGSLIGGSGLSSSSVNSSNLYLAFLNIVPSYSVELVCYGDTGSGNPIEWNFTYLYRFDESSLGVNGLSGLTWDNQPIYCSPEGGYCFNSWGGKKVTNYTLHVNGYIDKFVKWNLTELGLYGTGNTQGYPTFNLTDIYLLLTSRIQGRAYNSRANFGLTNPNLTVNPFGEGLCWLETSGLINYGNITVSVLVNNQLKSGVMVSICDDSSPYQMCYNSVTGIDGTTSALLPYDTYTVTAYHHGEVASKSLVADQPAESVLLSLTCSACANASKSYAGLVILNGQPINGSIITLFPDNPTDEIYMGITNGSGFFNITNIVGGDYTAEASVTLEHPYYSIHHVYISDNEFDYFILDSTKQVYGIVYDGYSSTVIPYSTVTLITANELIPRSITALSDVNGRFSIYVNSTFQTCVISNANIPCIYFLQGSKNIDGIVYGGIETIALTNQSTNIDLHLEGLSQTFNLSVSVYDNKTGDRIRNKNGTVRVTSGSYNQQCNIDNYGTCTLTSFKPGYYTVIANVTGYSKYTEYNKQIVTALSLNIEPVTTRTIRLTGRVTLDTNHSGLQGITVTAQEITSSIENPFGLFYTKYTDTDGYYNINVFPHRKWIIKAIDDTGTFLQTTFYSGGSVGIYIDNDFNYDFQMRYQNLSQSNNTVSVYGTIYDNSTGTPMGEHSVSIDVHCTNRTAFGRFYNTAGGKYNITGIMVNDYCYFTFDAGGGFVSQTKSFRVITNTPYDIQLENFNEEWCHVYGRVYKGGSVSYIDACTVIVKGNLNDGAGQFNCESSGLDKGKYTLTLRKGKDFLIDIISSGYTSQLNIPISTNYSYWDYTGIPGLLGECNVDTGWIYLYPQEGQQLCSYEITTYANSQLTLGIKINSASKIYFYNTLTGEDYVSEPSLVGYTHEGEFPCGTYKIIAEHYNLFPLIPSGIYENITQTHTFHYPTNYKVEYTFTKLTLTATNITTSTYPGYSGEHQYTDVEILQWLRVNVPPLFFLLVLMFFMSAVKRF